MNGALEKATRRDLRRAVGESALAVIEDLRSQIAQQRVQMDGMARRIEQVDADARKSVNDERTHRLKLADEQRTYVDRGDKVTDVRLDTFLRRGFFGRLKWLLFGR